jgi:hypothetical protein
MDWDAAALAEADEKGDGALPAKATLRWVKEVLGEDAEVDEESSDGIFASKSSVAVAVRVRPLSSRERTEGSSSVVSVPSPTTVRTESEVRCGVWVSGGARAGEGRGGEWLVACAERWGGS